MLISHVQQSISRSQYGLPQSPDGFSNEHVDDMIRYTIHHVYRILSQSCWSVMSWYVMATYICLASTVQQCGFGAGQNLMLWKLETKNLLQAHPVVSSGLARLKLCWRSRTRHEGLATVASHWWSIRVSSIGDQWFQGVICNKWPWSAHPALPLWTPVFGCLWLIIMRVASHWDDHDQ